MAGASALFAATIACAQTDIKRVLAYSTMSQLGYMFMGEAAGGFSSGIFHLTTHAYFKALLFMCAGAVIHALAGEQDMRKMGGLAHEAAAHVRAVRHRWAGARRDLPLRRLLEQRRDPWRRCCNARRRATPTRASGWCSTGGLLTAVLTGFYIFRLIFTVFLGSYRGGEIAEVHASHGGEFELRPATGRRGNARARDPLARVHESGPVMLVPMVYPGGAGARRRLLRAAVGTTGSATSSRR